MPGRDEIRMEVPQVDEMIDLLKKSATKLREVQTDMSTLAKEVDNGALVGQAGDGLSRALNNTLTAAMERLAQKLEERAVYVQRERDQLIQAGSDF